MALEQLAGIRAHGLEHQQAAGLAHQEVLLREALEHFDVGTRDLLCRLHRGPASEHGEASEYLRLRCAQQAVAPLERRAQRTLPRGGVPRTASKRV